MRALLRKLFGLDRRFLIELIADEYRGHQGVPFILFHHDGLPPELYEQIIPKHLQEDGQTLDLYLCSAADDTFSRAEVRALRKWFKEWPVRFTARPVGPIAENAMGVGALPVGGADDFYKFSEDEDFPASLPPIWGYLNLKHARSGPYVRDPSLSLMRVYMNDEGQVVVKRKPF